MVDRMSDSVLTKLLEAESELATQEASLLAQVEAIRQKRASLSAVVNMFATSETAPPEQPAPAAKRGRKPAQSKNQETDNSVPASLIDNLIEIATAIPEVAPEVAVATNGTAPEPPAPEPKAKRGRRAAQPSEAKTKPAASKSKTKSPARASKAKQTPKEAKQTPKETEPKPSPAPSKPKSASKEGRKSNNWRNYMRPEFGNAPLPEVVSSVLQRQSNGIFDVPTIVSTIFVQDTPKEVRNQARDRVLHILSAGVKEKKWYRGKTGQYSLSQSVAESTIDS